MKAAPATKDYQKSSIQYFKDEGSELAPYVTQSKISSKR
jgi:hypothetical protein